ncbi:MAG: amino acid adenylation domain-containing protein [Hyphomicrobiaceae bacterium]|nr:MAG: amino acid adenylation domain-containing protein [Hyphomicrobiaceae bacterium]
MMGGTVLQAERPDGASSPDRIRVLHEFFEQQVERRPEQPALECAGEVLSYRDLERRANQLAHHLRQSGVAPGSLVGVCLWRTPRLFIALLAVLKAGAGYVPIDPRFPRERVRYILGDAEAKVLLTDEAALDSARDADVGRVICLDREAEGIAAQPAIRPFQGSAAPSTHDLCYVIYTSGTTGHPKGVMIEHRSATNFVHAIRQVYRVNHTDRVYQGFSCAFDASVEEMWAAWSAGATLVAGTEDIVRSPADLSRFLESNRVTFFSTVPTLLAMIDSELPSVRLLIVGGEPCPAELVLRWARNGRRMLNTYGPTETTVVATCGECVPGMPVTIGKPIPGYSAYVLDEDMRPVRPGETGELFIGGDCLARGYVNLPKRTAESFLPNPLRCPGGESARVYRTHDQVRLMEDGTLQYIGRLDGQVKIRGFRIELSEIEAVLLEHRAVLAAAVKLYQRGEEKELAAFIVPSDPARQIDRDSIAELLRARLPSYMLPKYLDVVAVLPTSQSGKVDRAALPAPTTLLRGGDRIMIEPRDAVERRLARIWSDFFAGQRISIDDDFFLDLGGHSLLAAQLVSTLRKELGTTGVSVHDLYEHPTVRRLRKFLGHLQAGAEADGHGGAVRAGARSSRAVFDSVAPWKRWTCVVLQALSLYVYCALLSLPFLMLFQLARGVQRGELAWEAAAQSTTLIGFAAWPGMFAVSVAVKWLVIGRYKPGRYPVWGFYYFRWWLVNLFQGLSWSGMFVGTPLMSLYLRLMGARVGRNCTIDTPYCSIFDLVDIGNESSVGAETHILGYRIEDGELIIGKIEIGAGCFIGTQCALGIGVRMGDGAKLDDLSLLGDGAVMKAAESRSGSPATGATIRLAEPTRKDRQRRRSWLFGLIHLGLIYLMGYFLMLAAAPAAALVLAAFWYGGAMWAVAAAFAAVPLTILWFCTLLVAVKRLIGEIRPGVYALESGAYLRKWFSDFLLTNTRELLLPLFATLYLPPLLRLLGAKIGARAEISTVVQVSPDLLSVGDESFLADGAIIGARRIHGGLVEIRENRIGRRTFVGNGALVPPGVDLGEDCLLGVTSVPPRDQRCMPDGTRWLGSPPFVLPRTQQDASFDSDTTYLPPRVLVVQRLLVDAVRILLPGFISAAALVILVYGLLSAAASLASSLFYVVAPLLVLAAGIGLLLAVAGVKWLLLGRFRPTVQPLWSMYVWLNEVINGAYESIATPLLEPLAGTPFLPAYLRLLGCKVGRWTYIETTLFSEFDLVEIGDYAALNTGATIQTHLFEDRIMKSSVLRIGDECSVGNMAVILYDTEMKRGARVGPLSLLMKGETLPPFTYWHGVPTRPGQAPVASSATDSARGRLFFTRYNHIRGHEGRSSASSSPASVVQGSEPNRGRAAMSSS